MAKKKKIETDPGNRVLAENRKARFHYTIEETLECGIELKGTEVKSIKNGKFSFPDSYISLYKEELFIQGMHVTPYEFSNQFNHEPDRKKRLLAHKSEILKLKRKMDERGYSVVPLKFYLKSGRVKVLIGVGKGKKLHDKRNSIKERDVSRSTDREMRQH